VQEILHLDVDPTDFVFITLCLLSISWVLANIMTESSHCFPKWARISGGKHLHYGLPDILNGLLCSYLWPLWGTKEVIGGVTWQLITAIHVKGDMVWYFAVILTRLWLHCSCGIKVFQCSLQSQLRNPCQGFSALLYFWSA